MTTLTLPLRLAIVGGFLFAGLGVALLALGAHLVEGEDLLRAAALVSLLHGPLLLAVAAGFASGLLRGTAVGVAVFAASVGGALFAGDMLARVLAGNRLFPDAAPIGGGLQILGFVAAAVMSLFRRG